MMFVTLHGETDDIIVDVNMDNIAYMNNRPKDGFPGYEWGNAGLVICQPTFIKGRDMLVVRETREQIMALIQPAPQGDGVDTRTDFKRGYDTGRGMAKRVEELKEERAEIEKQARRVAELVATTDEAHKRAANSQLRFGPAKPKQFPGDLIGKDSIIIREPESTTDARTPREKVLDELGLPKGTEAPSPPKHKNVLLDWRDPMQREPAEHILMLASQLYSAHALSRYVKEIAGCIKELRESTEASPPRPDALALAELVEAVGRFLPQWYRGDVDVTLKVKAMQDAYTAYLAAIGQKKVSHSENP